jgi:hypothetical protein
MKDLVCGTIAGRLQQGPIGAALTLGYGLTTWNQDTDHFLTTAMAFEVSGAGYTSLGATVTGSTVSYDAASNEVRWTFANPSWTTASFSAGQMVVYDRFSGGTTTTWPVLMYVDFGGTQTVSAGTFTYVVSATGAGAITCS